MRYYLGNLYAFGNSLFAYRINGRNKNKKVISFNKNAFIFTRNVSWKNNCRAINPHARLFLLTFFFFVTVIFCNGCLSPRKGIINLPRVKFASKQRAAYSFRQVHISLPRDRARMDRGVLCRGC